MKIMNRKWLALVLALVMSLSLIGCGDSSSSSAPSFDSSSLLEGKLISVIGDSISTFDGINNNPAINPTLEGHAVYYTEGRYDMSPSDTWWQQTADALGAEILVNNSWSGSCVLVDNKGPDSASYGIRSENLHDTQGRTPDIVVIYMGTNDFDTVKDSFGDPSAVNYGTLLNADGTHGTPETFCEAYALMLAKVAGADPAKVYEAIKGGSAGSFVVNARINKFLTDDYSPSFRIDLHWKDLNNVLETGYELGTPLPLTKEVQNMFNYLRGAGEGGLDHAGVMRYYEKATGVNISD